MAVIDTPENVGRLPQHLPGHFTESVLPSASILLPDMAGSLPNNLPGNFNNIISDPLIPYNSVGFTLICRSASDFTAVLAILYDYVTMGYTEELSGVGAGSVTIDRDDPALLDQLLGANSIEDLLAKDNLWEVYFDGTRRFMWLGQNVQESLVNSNEDRVLTISGPGIGKSLEWGLVLPNKFPSFRPKVETVVDDFSDQDLDIYGRWTDNSGIVQSVGGRVNVQVTSAGGAGSYLATDRTYSMVESGAQARVVPAIGGNGDNGRIRTLMSVEALDGTARIFTDIDTDFVGYVLVAEVTNPSQIVRIPFNPSVHQYWRMQELDGKIIFSTRQENSIAWNTFAQLPYSFDANTVRLRLQVNAVAGNITLPATSTFALVNVDGVASPAKPMARYRRLLDKCQQRGTLKHIIPRWSDTRDSKLADWISDATVDVQVGADMLSVLDDYCSAIKADWFVDSEYRLNIWQRIDPLNNIPVSLFPIVNDDFERDEVGTFGTAPTGQIWEHLGNPAAFNVNGGVGRHTHTTTNTGRHSIIDLGTGNSRVLFAVAVPEVSSGTTGYTAYAVSRIPEDNSTDNVYQVRIAFLMDGRVTCSVRKREGAIPDTKVSIALPDYTYTPGVFHFVEMETVGPWVRGRVWPTTLPKPANWQVEWKDPNPLPETNTKVAFHTLTEPGNTNTYPFDFLISTFQASGFAEAVPKVTFYEAESQDTKSRTRTFGDVRNYVVGKTDRDEFLVKTDQDSINNFQQRETLLSSSPTKDMASLETVVDNHLTSVKDGSNTWTLTVPHDVAGKRLYQNYVLGDWVSVHNAFPFRKDLWRIVAIAISVDSDGNPTIELTLNDKLTPYWMKVQEEIKKNRWPLPPRRSLPGRSQNPGWYAA